MQKKNYTHGTSSSPLQNFFKNLNKNKIIKIKYVQKNVLLGVTCRPSLNNSHILLLSPIYTYRLLNTDNNNNQNSASEVTDNTDHNEGEQSGVWSETDSDSSDTAYNLLDCPVKDLTDDRLRENIRNLKDSLRYPGDEISGRDEDSRAEILQTFAERLQELEGEFQIRKDEGVIPEHETIPDRNNPAGVRYIRESDSDSGVGTSIAPNNGSSTGSDSLSRVSNENSPDSFDNFFESVYLFDSLNLDSSILEFVILYLPYIRIVLLLLPFVFLLKISKLL